MRQLIVGLSIWIAYIVNINESFTSWIFKSGSTSAIIIHGVVSMFLGYIMGTVIAGWAKHEKSKLEEQSDQKKQNQALLGYDTDNFKFHD